ncbi:MFS transporter [Saccharopolyspora halophila]
MTDPIEPTAPATASTSAAIVESRTAPRGFTIFVAFAAIGAGAAQMSAALLTLTLKATELDSAAATTIISLSSGIAGAFTLIALPTVGALSDRTRSRLGRRRPYLLAAAAAFALGGLLLITAPAVPVLVLAHLLITTGFVTAGVTTTALVADQLPPDERGPVTAMLSMGTPLGALVGMAVGTPFGDRLVPLVLIPTAIAVVAVLLLAAVIHDPRADRELARLDWRELLAVFWVNPLRFPDFALVFASRLLVFSGVAALNGYQAIFLLRELDLSPAQLGGTILLTVVINAGVTMLTAPAVGRLTDALNVRKPFVLAAAMILGAGLLIASAAPGLGVYLFACGVVGLGQGVYFAVELVLATRVLPDPDNPAKDLGLLKIADNLPVALVAAVAPVLLAIGASGGENFAALFIAGAIAAFAGGSLILFIRGAR